MLNKDEVRALIEYIDAMIEYIQESRQEAPDGHRATAGVQRQRVETARKALFELTQPRATRQPVIQDCPECDGRGKYLDAPQNALDGSSYWATCHVCGGSGKA